MTAEITPAPLLLSDRCHCPCGADARATAGDRMEAPALKCPGRLWYLKIQGKNGGEGGIYHNHGVNLLI